MVRLTRVEGSDLYHRMLNFDYGASELQELMAHVWESTPWIVDAYSDRINSDRERDMLAWCREQFGDEAWPIHGRPGTWQRGSATVHGWTWFGFATEDQLDQFCTRFPAQVLEAHHEQ